MTINGIMTEISLKGKLEKSSFGFIKTYTTKIVDYQVGINVSYVLSCIFINKIIYVKAATLLILLIPALLISQRVAVEQVYESRSTGDSYYSNRTELRMGITGDELRRHKFVRIANLSKVEDDQGFDLIDQDSKTDFADISGTYTSATVYIQNASRKAETIKEVSGTLEFYSPTEKNGGIVKIPKFLSKTAVDLLPKEKNLDVRLITQDSYKNLVEEQQKLREEEIAKQTPEVQEMMQAVSEIMSAFAYNDWSYPQVNLSISGDESRIVSVRVEKPDGTELTNQGHSFYDGMKTYYFGEDIEADYTLVINLHVAEAIKVVPFTIKDVILP